MIEGRSHFEQTLQCSERNHVKNLHVQRTTCEDGDSCYHFKTYREQSRESWAYYQFLVNTVNSML
jgi:hypothetical protein